MECHSCGNVYSRITTHWTKSNSCNHPKFTDEQHQILTGLLMGDGSVDDRNDERRNPRLRAIMTNREYLEYLRSKFPILSKDVMLHRSSEQIVENLNDESFSNTDDPSDVKDQYKWQTISHPDIERYAKWYRSGGKIWPRVDLTPITLKHLYVCDGSFNNNGSRFYVEIHCSNERLNMNKIEKMFSDAGLNISRWRDDKTEYGTYKTSLILNRMESEQFFDYIGKSLPGFSYKWP